MQPILPALRRQRKQAQKRRNRTVCPCIERVFAQEKGKFQRFSRRVVTKRQHCHGSGRVPVRVTVNAMRQPCLPIRIEGGLMSSSEVSRHGRQSQMPACNVPDGYELGANAPVSAMRLQTAVVATGSVRSSKCRAVQVRSRMAGNVRRQVTRRSDVLLTQNVHKKMPL